MISWLGFVVVVLAAYRVTRVVTTDSISEAARDRLYRWAWIDPGEDGYEARYALAALDDAQTDPTKPLPRNGGARTYVNELFNCPWCLGVWVAAALTCVWWAWHDVEGVRLVFVIAAVAGAQGFVASRVDA